MRGFWKLAVLVFLVSMPASFFVGCSGQLSEEEATQSTTPEDEEGPEDTGAAEEE